MRRSRVILIWAALALAFAVPLIAAATSPLLAWREPVYIIAGFAGIIAMGLLLVQPLLMGGYLPGFSPRQRRRLHFVVGGLLVFLIMLHVAGLWITSPPDVIDSLLFVSPTPFSAWGVIAMWAILTTAVVAIFRKVLKIGPGAWRVIHMALAVVIVAGSVLHALLIVGTMETISKTVLCGLTLIATFKVIAELRARNNRKRLDV